MKWNVAKYIMDNTARSCIKRFKRHRPLLTNLYEIFDHLCDNLQILYGFDNSIHIFIDKSGLNIDVLGLPNSLGYKSLKTDQITKDSLKGILYNRTQIERILPEAHGWFCLHNPKKIFEILGAKELLKSEDKVYILPFDFYELDLGCFVLWKKSSSKNKSEDYNETVLINWIESIYNFLKELLISEYEINLGIDSIYLPLIQKTTWNKVAILFADIMNFDLLSDKIGAKHGEEGNTNILRTILNKYCEEMSIVVQKNGLGRITNFFGTQIMAVYGEHEDEPTEAVGNAIYSALKMIRKFDEIKSNFLQDTYGNDYQTEYNEDINLYLRIGIDFGNVLFDYLGNDYHREYTAFGNHVEFAKFLNRESLKAVRENSNDFSILISKTANRCVIPWLLPEYKEKLKVYDAEKGRNYDIYNVKKFDEDYFLECRKNRNWDAAWNNQDCSKP